MPVVITESPLQKLRLPRIVDALTTAVAIVIVTALVAGSAEGLFGGSFSRVGDGYGGLWGVPALALPLVALVLGAAAAIGIARRLGRGSGRLRMALLVMVGVWVVAIGYSEVAHLVDPCVRGWWDEQSRVGSQQLCERFGSELNWNTRFHLLAHAVPAAALLALHLGAVHRWHAHGRPHRRHRNPAPSRTRLPANGFARDRTIRGVASPTCASGSSVGGEKAMSIVVTKQEDHDER